MDSQNNLVSDVNKLKSSIKNMLYLAVTLEATSKLAKTRESDKQELSNYIANKLMENN